MLHNPYEWITEGAVATRFGERVTRVEHRGYADPTPLWFSPRTNAGHIGLHKDGFSCYLEVTLDHDARAAKHPFEVDVRPTATHIEQLDLFLLHVKPDHR